jgi:hypothetical protein
LAVFAPLNILANNILPINEGVSSFNHTEV